MNTFIDKGDKVYLTTKDNYSNNVHDRSIFVFDKKERNFYILLNDKHRTWYSDTSYKISRIVTFSDVEFLSRQIFNDQYEEGIFGTYKTGNKIILKFFFNESLSEFLTRIKKEYGIIKSVRVYTDDNVFYFVSIELYCWE